MHAKLLANFKIALDAILSNLLRSTLTALGIIFGVAAVIAMLAIGNGAQQEILEQIRLVGVNNIVITPVIEQVEEEVTESFNMNESKFSPGLTLQDANSIYKIIPGIVRVSPEILMETFVIKNGIRRSAKLVGVDSNYFELTSFKLASGTNFNPGQLERGDPVCIIGRSIQTRFFSQEDPIGKRIKCGQHWLRIIGVLEQRLISEQSIANLGIRDYNMDVYTPINSMLIRFKNRSRLTSAIIERANRNNNNNNQEEESARPVNYHQLDRLVVQVGETDQLNATSEIVARMLERRHYGVIDYEITIPELLLKQQQRTKRIFNIVLGAIAAISLLVGGIGIMNIMLASVLERIKEIGLRLAVGAEKRDIVIQFLYEAMLISVAGGIGGILLGWSFAYIVSKVADIPTIVSFYSILLAFGVAASVGLIFGITPARKAAEQDPIASLRYE
ncbi:MAG: ABC transporter substrate-binding protein [Cyclobacteriaceae bacterium]|nr:MAG: ABC transporter substrate-binding protein [Cyclobacteriaceae bacterium]